jgi:hypothetical protein
MAERRPAASAAAAGGSGDNSFSGDGGNEDGKLWAQVLGARLVRHAGEGAPLEKLGAAAALAGKHVGLYFSAHW